MLTAHVPVTLAEKVDQFSKKLERSRGWIMKQALASWIEREENRDHLTREALSDLDVGAVVDHSPIQDWANYFNS